MMSRARTGPPAPRRACALGTGAIGCTVLGAIASIHDCFRLASPSISIQPHSSQYNGSIIVEVQFGKTKKGGLVNVQFVFSIISPQKSSIN